MPDSYVSQFSGEEIDSAVRAAQIISGASTPAELREKLEIRGDNIPVSAEDSTLISEALKKIHTTSGGGVNPNLLDNWYFGRPVNQRGQTEYTAAGYTVDRWKLVQWNTDSIAVKITNLGLNVSCSADGKSNSTYIEEKVDLPFAGKIVTFSAIISAIAKNTNTLGLFLRANDALLASSRVTTTGVFSLTYTFPEDFDGVVSFEIGQCGSEGGSGSCDFTILAAKLELGDTQTLAHKENGVWVLNEIPDYGEQLRRCQRYAVEENYHTTVGQLNYAGDRFIISVQFPCTMRTTSVITLKEISAFGWGALPISGAEVTWNDKFGFFVAITDLTNMNNFIGKACSVKYFASADL